MIGILLHRKTNESDFALKNTKSLLVFSRQWYTFPWDIPVLLRTLHCYETGCRLFRQGLNRIGILTGLEETTDQEEIIQTPLKLQKLQSSEGIYHDELAWRSFTAQSGASKNLMKENGLQSSGDQLHQYFCSQRLFRPSLFQEAESTDRVSLISFNYYLSDQTGLSSLSSITVSYWKKMGWVGMIFLTRKYSTVAKTLALTMLGTKLTLRESTSTITQLIWIKSKI